MQQPHTIEIEITPQGEVKATVQGVKGAACADISAFLDELGEVAEDRVTAEFYEQPTAASPYATVGGGQG
ncbi:MAG: DUF2997 domain-containing protein [Anaerolineae bacterium]|jgi:hypothetical protein